ncbi:sensor domain-containing phosphodiesterase [Oryzibacter oryziterrae]|uniref:sensor domain-containing phosphodiesterase n=1 Tax=Oryzibacter oryziterrae TaxID=2766474 RepID=UPI001F2B86CA|nr:EAL domain-containing protein [Oryzibacter oryziterrae]
MPLTEAQEELRLRELYRYQILDTPREPEFDGFCELARSFVGGEIACISFVDRDRVWFKSMCGYDLAEVPRTSAFSAVVVETGVPLIIPDTKAEPTYDNHPIAMCANPVRSVVCLPIQVRKGVIIGALSAMSLQPRDYDEETLRRLRLLHSAIVDRLQLRLARIERVQDKARKAKKNAEIAAQKWELGKQRVLLEQTSRLARIGGWEYDLRLNAMTWSGEVYRILELDPGQPGPQFHEVPAFYRQDVREEVRDMYRKVCTEGGGFEMEIPISTAKGHARWIRCICEAESRRGQVVRLVGTIQDITLQRETEEEVSFIATHDLVTGLINRGVFQERLEKSLLADGRNVGRKVALFMVDVDHFKAVNDTLGHHAGDVLLAEVGRRLSQAVGRRGVVGRLGGDEFALLVPEAVDEAEMQAMAEAMMRELIAPIAYEAESIPVTISVGVVVGEVGNSADQLLKDADIALYEAKGAGRNRYVLFDRSMRDELELRHSILRAIRIAIEKNELILYYQPKLSLRTGVLTGFEALLRWRRPDGYVASPGFFGAALEDPQLGQAIGDLVIAQAVEQAARWEALGFAYDHIAINVSTSQFRRGDLSELILGTLQRHGLRSSALMVEVTENVLLSKAADNVQSTLVSLANSGIKIALDDFGTGFASLTHLKEFPVDLLKIDRSFVSNLTDQRESRAIVRGITALAHDLGVAVIAEGIETPAQRDMLRHFGADFGQGYLFARPMPPEQVETVYFAEQEEQALKA